MHVGAEEAIFGFSRAVLQPGDHVIVQWPCYQSLHECAASRGCYVTPWKVPEAAVRAPIAGAQAPPT